jgi:hypothetical protein
MGKPNTVGPSKPDVARALLLKGTVFMHLDPRHEDVIVPPWFKDQPQLVLQIGMGMAVPIRDLRVDEHGVVATLSFNRSPFTCHVPWRSVFALAGDDGLGRLWAESMPEEVAAEVEREVQRMAIRVAEAEARADATADGASALREEGLSRDDFMLDDGAPARDRRRATRGAKKHQPSVERVPRGKRKAPSFQVIAGEGEAAPRMRLQRSSRPAHLRLVK